MYVITSDGRHISSVSSCFDCITCETIYAEDKKTEISREYPILMRVTVSWMHKIK